MEVAAGEPGRFGGFGVEVAAGGLVVSERRAPPGAFRRFRSAGRGRAPEAAKNVRARPRRARRNRRNAPGGAGRGETTRPPAADGTEKPEKRPGPRRRTERRNRRICMEPCTEKPEDLQARPGMEKPEKRQCGFR